MQNAFDICTLSASSLSAIQIFLGPFEVRFRYPSRSVLGIFHGFFRFFTHQSHVYSGTMHVAVVAEAYLSILNWEN